MVNGAEASSAFRLVPSVYSLKIFRARFSRLGMLIGYNLYVYLANSDTNLIVCG